MLQLSVEQMRASSGQQNANFGITAKRKDHSAAQSGRDCHLSFRQPGARWAAKAKVDLI
jgi:hypothetical protein